MVEENKDYKEYGNWTRVRGRIEDFSEKEIEEFKSVIYESAGETLKEIGVNIFDQHIEWVIQQAYWDGIEFVSPDHPLATPFVTIAWKTKVKNNGMA